MSDREQAIKALFKLQRALKKIGPLFIELKKKDLDWWKDEDLLELVQKMKTTLKEQKFIQKEKKFYKSSLVRDIFEISKMMRELGEETENLTEFQWYSMDFKELQAALKNYEHRLLNSIILFFERKIINDCAEKIKEIEREKKYKLQGFKEEFKTKTFNEILVLWKKEHRS